MGLPCQQQQQRRRSRRRPPKAAGCCCWQGRQDRPRPDQAKARHNEQAKSRLPAGSLQGPGPKGVLAWPGTPRDPKSHLFVTKWVAIPPYGTPGTAFCTEFRRGSRQIGPTPSISTLFLAIFGPNKWKNAFFGDIFCPCKERAVGSNRG